MAPEILLGRAKARGPGSSPAPCWCRLTLALGYFGTQLEPLLGMHLNLSADADPVAS